MNRPKAGLLVALLVVSTLLLPLASADHAYSHRYIIYGRVVDADGNPVPGTLVDVRPSPDFKPEGECAQQPGTATEAFGRTETKPQTNEFGEFTYCWHTHEINRVQPPTADVSVKEYNYSTTITFDPYFREQFVAIKLASPVAAANKTVLDTQYTVVGRLWEPAGGRVTVEGIPVLGDTIKSTNISVTLVLPDGTKKEVQTFTNNYGDFAVRIPTTSRVTAGKVVVSAAQGTFETAVDPTLGTTGLHFEIKKPFDPFLKGALIVVGVLVAIAVIGGGGWWAIRRSSSRRQEEAARARSTRKRANK